VGLLLLGHRAAARPGFERVATTTADAAGAPLTVVFHYAESPRFAPSVRAILRDGAKRDLDGTPYCRDIWLLEAGDGTVYVFAADLVTVFFRGAWVVADRRLVETHNAACYPYALWAAARAHWRPWLISVALGLAYAFIRRPRTRRRPAGPSAVLLFFLVAWVFLMLMFGQMPAPHLLALSGLGLMLRAARPLARGESTEVEPAPPQP
jgi:hypothetical protein